MKSALYRREYEKKRYKNLFREKNTIGFLYNFSPVQQERKDKKLLKFHHAFKEKETNPPFHEINFC